MEGNGIRDDTKGWKKHNMLVTINSHCGVIFLNTVFLVYIFIQDRTQLYSVHVIKTDRSDWLAVYPLTIAFHQ